MALLKLNGKEYELKFTYMAILQLERHYGKGVGKIFTELDLENLGTLTVFVWACLKQYKEWNKKTVDDVAQAISDSLESEDITFEDLGNAIQQAVEQSVLVKGQAQEQDKKK